MLFRSNSIFFLVISLGLICLSHYLFARFKKENEGQAGALCMTFYVLTFIQFWVIFCVFVLIGYIIQAFKKWLDSPYSNPISSNDDYLDKEYQIRDERGYTRTLSYDKYTKTFRDGSGAYWETADKGKTFQQIKK